MRCGHGSRLFRGPAGRPYRTVSVLSPLCVRPMTTRTRTVSVTWAEVNARLFPGAAYERALAGGQAGDDPVLAVAGTVAGVWRRRPAGKRIAVTVEPLTDLRTGRLGELEEQVARMRGAGGCGAADGGKGDGGSARVGLRARQRRTNRMSTVSPPLTTKSPFSHRITASRTSPCPSRVSWVPTTVHAPP
ncbi:hypothetical protein QFZ58_002769 [Streptomyces sp. B1I3]|nr:hypothetical protein [Streptomyces sp. B1I3]